MLRQLSEAGLAIKYFPFWVVNITKMFTHCSLLVTRSTQATWHLNKLWCDLVFILAEVGWCPLWRTYFSTPSLKARRWSLSRSSSLWVNSTFTLPLSCKGLSLYMVVHANTPTALLYFLKAPLTLVKLSTGAYNRNPQCLHLGAWSSVKSV